MSVSDEDGGRVLLAARDGEQVVGAARLELPRNDNAHLCELVLAVHPAHRRRGVGRALDAEVVRRARADGRTTLLGYGDEPPDRDGASEVRRGRSPSATTSCRPRSVGTSTCRCRPPSSPTSSSAARRYAEDYEVRTWWDAVPDELVDDCAALSVAMSTDVPKDGMDWREEVWDAARVRRDEARSVAMDRTYAGAGAVTATGRMVAFTTMGAAAVGPAAGLPVGDGRRPGAPRPPARHAGQAGGAAASWRPTTRGRRSSRTWNAQENGPMIARERRARCPHQRRVLRAAEGDRLSHRVKVASLRPARRAVTPPTSAATSGSSGSAGPELDEVHRRQHEAAAQHDPRAEPLAAEQHREQARPDRLHRHDDRGAGRLQVRLRPRLHHQRERPGDERHVDQRRPVAGRLRQREPPGTAPAPQTTVIVSSCTTVRPRALRPVLQAPSPTMWAAYRAAEARVSGLAAADREALQRQRGEAGGGQADGDPDGAADPRLQQHRPEQRGEHDVHPGHEARDGRGGRTGCRRSAAPARRRRPGRAARRAGARRPSAGRPSAARAPTPRPPPGRSGRRGSRSPGRARRRP